MTTKLPSETYLPIWEAADAEEFGIEVLVEPKDQVKLVNALYACKQAVGGFTDLMIVQPQPPGTLFIAKKTVELD